MMRSAFIGVLLTVLAAAQLPARAEDRAPVLLELYTSQGCAPCRIADAYMADLVRRPDVIPLSLHIDYWDSPAWKDEFALSEATARQQSYKRSFGMNYVYTPQFVVDGRAHVSGRLRDKVEGLIAQAKARKSVPITLKRGANGTVTAELPDIAKSPAAASAASDVKSEPATLWLFLYDRPHTVDILGGENAGLHMTYYNVVRNMARIGTWQGAAQTVEMQITDSTREQRGGMVVFLQQGVGGPILGAASLSFDKDKSS